MNNWIASPGASLSGSLRVPGDKSISHRAVMLGALAAGVTRISGFLEGEDTRATARVFSQLGVRIEAPSEGERIVHGVGLRGLRGSDRPLDCGNAGTGMRLLAGVLAGQAFDSTLIGDASLSRRPMRRVIDPLSSMGARIDSEPGGLPPLRIHGGSRLTGVAIDTPVASAQVKSALLLAGLYADGETVVREPHPTREYTERMLSAFGWPIEFSPGYARLRGGQRLHAIDASFTTASVTTWAGYKAYLRKMYNYCARGSGGAPNLVVFDQGSFENYENSLDPQVRYSDTKRPISALKLSSCAGPPASGTKWCLTFIRGRRRSLSGQPSS